MMTAGIIRIMLVVDIIAMSLLALVFIRQRRMNWMAYFGWCFIAVAIPVLGPFFVITRRPGTWNPDYSILCDFRRLVNFVRRVLPEPSQPTNRLRRARQRKLLRQR